MTSSEDSDIFATLGRMHVLIRRGLNRITDIEYARHNLDYAREMVGLVRQVEGEEAGQLAERLVRLLHLDAPSAAPADSAPAPRKYLFSLR